LETHVAPTFRAGDVTEGTGGRSSGGACVRNSPDAFDLKVETMNERELIRPDATIHY
jgi:hypothetical protein